MSAVTAVARRADRSTDDLDLVAAVRAGDDRAFELLFARYQGRIAAYVRGMLRDHGRAEDVTQEVFIAALRRMRETDREIAFRPWIYEIAKNACIDAFRRSRNVREVSFDARDALGPADHVRLAAPGSAADAVVDAKLAIDDLCGAFGGLSRTHHEILVMREFDGLSYREIGERLGISRAAVESTLFRARRRLGEEYAEIASGERCLRVRAIVDERAGRDVGPRDRRRVARHLPHCQPCRRYAHLADVGVARAPAVVRIAAFLPLPAFVRRRFGLGDAVQLLGGHGPSAVRCSQNVVGSLDPSTLSGWSKAAATAATVAVASIGAGAAVHGPHGLGQPAAGARGIAGHSGHGASASGARALARVGRSADLASSVRHRMHAAGSAPRRSASGAASSATSKAAVPSHGRPAGATTADGSPPSMAGTDSAGAGSRKPATVRGPVDAVLDAVTGRGNTASSQPSQTPGPLGIVGSLVGTGTGTGTGTGDAASASRGSAGSGSGAAADSPGTGAGSAQPVAGEGTGQAGSTPQQGSASASGGSGALPTLGQVLRQATSTGSH